MNVIYKQTGDYLIPDLKLKQPGDLTQTLGKYGRMRMAYLRKHRPILFNQMLLQEKLYPYLRKVEQMANDRLKYQSEETILTELIYS